MDTYARAFPAFPAFQQVLMLPPDDVSNFQAKFARIWWSVHYRYILLHIKSFPNFKSIRRVCYFVSFLYQVACTLGALRTERAGLGPLGQSGLKTLIWIMIGSSIQYSLPKFLMSPISYQFCFVSRLGELIWDSRAKGCVNAGAIRYLYKNIRGS